MEVPDPQSAQEPAEEWAPDWAAIGDAIMKVILPVVGVVIFIVAVAALCFGQLELAAPLAAVDLFLLGIQVPWLNNDNCVKGED